MENLKVDLKLEGNELIVRTGEAQKVLDPIKPVRLQINGDFRAVGQFLAGRKSGLTDNLQQLALVKDAIIYTDKESLSLKLDCNPNNPEATVVSGKAELSEELKLFGVNSGKRYRRNELVQLLRMNRAFFYDKEEHQKLLTALMKFTAKTSGDSKAGSDTRGNVDLAYSKTVESNVPEYFRLNVPIIKGEGKEVFTVEVCLDEENGSSSFWFESPELAELKQTKVEEIFERELEHCKGFVIINV